MRALAALACCALLLALAATDPQATLADEAVGGGRGPWDAVADDSGAKVSTDVVKDPRDPACYDCALLGRGGGVRPNTADAAAAVRGGSGVRAPSVGAGAVGGGAVVVGAPQLAPAPAPAGAPRRHSSRLEAG